MKYFQQFLWRKRKNFNVAQPHRAGCRAASIDKEITVGHRMDLGAGLVSPPMFCCQAYCVVGNLAKGPWPSESTSTTTPLTLCLCNAIPPGWTNTSAQTGDMSFCCLGRMDALPRQEHLLSSSVVLLLFPPSSRLVCANVCMGLPKLNFFEKRDRLHINVIFLY